MPEVNVVFADASGRQYPDTLPLGYEKGAAGGIAALNAQGKVVDKDGNEVTAFSSTIATPAADAAGLQVVNAQWVRNLRMTIENLPFGAEQLVKCWDGLQLPRAQYTSRADVVLIYARLEQPLMGGEYGIPGVDRWRREHWASP